MLGLVSSLIVAAGLLIPEGHRAPRLEATTFEGTEFSEQLSGRVTIVEFFATWCPHCRRSMAGYQRLKETRDVRLIIVDVEENPALVAAFLAEHPPPTGAGVLLDPTGAASRAWRVKGFPTTYLLDQNGVVRDAFSGWADDSARDLAEQIDALQRPPAAPKNTQAIGAPPPAEAARTATKTDTKRGRPRRRGKNAGPATPPGHDERAFQMGVEVIR